MTRLRAVRVIIVALIVSHNYFSEVSCYCCSGSTFRLPTGPTVTNSETLILERILKNYDRRVRPVKNASNSVNVWLGITLTQIFDLDEKNQVLTTNVWLDQKWNDEFVDWNPLEYDNLTRVRVPCQYLWLPDIVLYNSADDYTAGYMESRAMVEYNGIVFWPPPTKFRSTCLIDVTYFPFDDQKCILKLGSWTYDGIQVNVENSSHIADLSNYIPNGEWELLATKLVKNEVFYTCCKEPYGDVTLTIWIRRKTLYYMHNVVAPCMMMSILTLLVFCLPPDSGEKIALGITVLLAFSVFMLAIAEKMPETSESIPLIGIYLTAVMTITSVSVVMTVVVLNFHYCGPSKKEVPEIVRNFLRNRLGFPYSKKPPTRSTSLNATLSSSATPYYESCPLSYSREPQTYSSALNRSENLKLTIENIHEELKESADYSSNESIGNLNLSDYTNMNHKRICSRRNKVVQDEVLRTLRHLISKQEQDENHMRIVHEWRLIAQMIDTVLFWFFFVGTLTSSLTLLVILPLFNRQGYT